MYHVWYPTKTAKPLKEALVGMTHNKTPHKSERRLVCQNGLELWANFHVVLETSPNGDPLYYIVQIADITDLKQSPTAHGTDGVL